MGDGVLADGRYDVFVVDADDDGGTLRLDLTVVAGDHKGEVVTITAPASLGDPISLMGMPATLAVDGGRPHLTIDS